MVAAGAQGMPEPWNPGTLEPWNPGTANPERGTHPEPGTQPGTRNEEPGTAETHRMDYQSSGVDIDAGNETVRRIKRLARGTFTPGVLSEIGSFGGLFDLSAAGLREPVLVSSAD